MRVRSVGVEESMTPLVPIKSVDDFGPEMGWEFPFAAKHPTLYPVVRTLADLIPFLSKIFPSEQKRFKESSIAEKIFDVGLDAAVFFPWAKIGKGLAVSAQRMLPRMPFALRTIEATPKSALDDLARRMQRFEWTTPADRLVAKHGVLEEEAKAMLRGETEAWISVGRSGGRIPQRSPELQKLLVKRGEFKEPVKKELEYLASFPSENALRASERLTFFKDQYRAMVQPMVNVRGKFSVSQVFDHQVGRLFGKEEIGRMTLENVGQKEFSRILMDTLLNEGRILRGIDVTSRHYLLPVRKVMEAFDATYRTIERIYKPLKFANGLANTDSALSLRMFHERLVDHGVGKLGTRGFKPFITRGEWDEAGRLLRRMDDLQESGAAQNEITDVMNSASTQFVKKIIKGYQEWTDYMYGEYARVKIPQLFESAGMTTYGARQFNALMMRKGGLGERLTAMFSNSLNYSYEDKVKMFYETMRDLRETARKNPTWFTEPEDDAVKLLFEKLTPMGMEKGGKFPSYLRNYTARVFDDGTTRMFGRGYSAEGIPSWTKARMNDVAEGATTDLSRIVSSRIRSQSRDLYMRPILQKIDTAAKEMPEGLSHFVKHYTDRLLGVPSRVDRRVADIINRTFGTVWDDRRVMNLAYQINDLVYMGGIGFKPFSAMRNYFQPLLTVPADMGGTKDLRWLAQGYFRAAQRDTRAYLREIGAITEYSPDILLSTPVMDIGRATGLGFNLPTKTKIRDSSMWLFKMSDQHNRYVTGGAALAKWDHYIRKFSRVGRDGRTIMGGPELREFTRKLNLPSREVSVAADIERLLRNGNFEDAKALWTRDVVADTQFLYGPADSPLVTQATGSVGKTVAVFQSWWMNYGSLLGKWATRTGDVPATASRMFSWMLSSAIAATVMQQIWDRPTVARTVLLGPLPVELDVPPSWRPFVEALKLSIEAGGVAVGVAKPETALKRVKAIINSSLIFVPGGYQLRRFAKGAQEEGFPGFIKEIVRYEPTED